MQNPQISFGTKIIIRDNVDFFDTIRPFAKSADFPWTRKQIVRGSQVFTKDIATCTAGGIIVKNPRRNCFEMVEFHIDPMDRVNKKIEPIKNTIYKKIGKSTPVQAFLFGCRGFVDYSVKMFDNLEEIIKSFNIPYTKLKGIKLGSYMSSAYDGYKNELSIFLPIIESSFGKRFSLNNIPEVFDKIKLASIDSFEIDQKFGRNMDITDEERKYLLAQS